jgi:hypothetical protein
VDKFTADKFHENCDNKGPTLTIIKTTTDHVFGGYTTASWDKSGGYKEDSNSFVFSLNHRAKYPIAKDYHKAILCHPSFGP